MVEVPHAGCSYDACDDLAGFEIGGMVPPPLYAGAGKLTRMSRNSRAVQKVRGSLLRALRGRFGSKCEELTMSKSSPL
jgi:hypothetical protein